MVSSRPALAYHETVTPEAVDALTSILKKAEAINEQGESASCQLGTTIGNAPPCGFLAQCQLLSERKNEKYIYKNSRGEQAPNPKLISLQKELKACLKFVGKDPDKIAASSAVGEDPRKAAQVGFYKSVAANGEERALLEILQASAELAMGGSKEAEPDGAGGA